MPVVTVIMPVYKVEEFVARTIESVLAQTLTDIEFIAVDDGSPDRSGEICDSYAALDSRLRVIHQENAGAPAARNAALDIASGKYIYFIDSDDWIEPDMLEKMAALAEENHASLIVTGFLMEYWQDGKNVTYRTPSPDRNYESIEEFRREAYKYFNSSLLSLPWNKLFVRDEIERIHLRFPNTKWDDHHFCMDYLMDCRSVVLTSAADYHWYRSRKGSETMINYSDIRMFEKRREHFAHILRLYRHWGIRDSASIDGISCYYVGRLVQCVQELADNKTISSGERRERVKAILSDRTTKAALRHAESLSKTMRIMSAPMKIENVTLSLAVGGGVSLVRRLMPGLFIRLKEKEVHGA